MLRRHRCLMRRASMAYVVSLAVAVAASLVTCARCCRATAAPVAWTFAALRAAAEELP